MSPVHVDAARSSTAHGRARAPEQAPCGVVGLLLAAGAGSRFGGPKALARTQAGVPWVVDRVEVLEQGGCVPVLVVLGAGASEALELLPETAVPVPAREWSQGLSSSLRAGLRAASALLDPAPVAALVALVDTPGLTAPAVRRLTRLVHEDTSGAVLARATYRGQVGHPVLLGRRHWAAVSEAAIGDRGAAPYLETTGTLLVECSDVADGEDVDERPTAASTPAGERWNGVARGPPRRPPAGSSRAPARRRPGTAALQHGFWSGRS